MAIFKGTIQEFHHFLGPRIRNSINNFTRKYRNQRDGICENCSGKKELHSAHVHGQERRSIIEKILFPYLHEGQARCNIETTEKEILKAHLPIDNCFKFLCHSCHVAYDSKTPSPTKGTAAKNNSSKEFKKINRIKLWANRPHQDNHKIIEAYLHLERNGAANFDMLKALCCNKSNSRFFVKKFDGHYASMKTDKGNSHGKVFYDKNGSVYIWPIVREEIKIYFDSNS